MAYVHRLIFCVLVALSAWVPCSSYAATLAPTMAPKSQTLWVDWKHGNSGQNYGSGDAACSAFAVSVGAVSGALGAVVNETDTNLFQQCVYTYQAGQTGISNVVAYTKQISAYCTDSVNYQLSSDQSICNLKVDPGAADAARCSAASGGVDLYSSSAYQSVGGAYCPASGNGAKCGSSVTGGYATVKGGVKSWITEVTYDGSVCTPPAAGSAAAMDAPTTCKGQTGTVNGVSVCIPFSGTNPPAETVTQSKNTATDGTVTTAVVDTSCNGTTCTTTTTTTVSGGAAGGTTAPTTTAATDTKPQTTFCTDNPASPMCKTSSYSGGACGTAPACDGDAIQCAIAASAFKTSCAYDNTAAATTEEGRYDAAKVVTGDQSVDAANPLGFAVTPGSFDRTNLLGAEVGLSDLSVTVMGRVTTLPFSGLNTWFAILGNILMGCTALLCMRIVARG